MKDRVPAPGPQMKGPPPAGGRRRGAPGGGLRTTNPLLSSRLPLALQRFSNSAAVRPWRIMATTAFRRLASALRGDPPVTTLLYI